MTQFKCCAVIAAAGCGRRMGEGILKQYIEIEGVPVLARAISAFENCGGVSEIVIVTAAEEKEYCKREIIGKYNFRKAKKIAEGGAQRQESVYSGLKALEKDTDIVLIHDGARPFIKCEHIEKIIRETVNYGCCVLGARVKDTIKNCGGDGKVIKTLERNGLWIAQTPQAFKYKIIMDAYKRAFSDGFYGTDDSMLAERLGIPVKMVEGDYNNIKITTKEDLAFGEAIIKSEK